MRRKWIAAILAVALTLSVAGCGGENPKESESQSGTQKSEQQAEQTSEQSGTGEAAGEEEVNLYGYDEPVTIKIGVSYAAAADFSFKEGESVENNAWMALYRSNNIYPEILYEVDPSQAATKLSTAIMSGDYPDIFGGTFAEYNNYVQSGAVADITEAFEKYASEELKAYLYADGGLSLNGLYVDGKLYGLPRVGNPRFGKTFMMWIRQDWLDNLGLKIPENIEELQEVARAFTFDDPDGNGKNDTYGLALDGVNVFNGSIGDLKPVFNAFGCYPEALTYIENEAQEIVWGGSNAEGAKAALTVLREMYEEGTIAKDFITMNSDKIFEEAGAGRCGIWFAPNWGGMEASMGAVQIDPACHIVAAPIPTGTDEPTKLYVSSVSPSGPVYFVSSKCANPEVLVKLMNLAVKYCNPAYCTPEEYNMYFGDGLNYTGWKLAIVQANPSNGNVAYESLQEALATGDESVLTDSIMKHYNAFKIYLESKELQKNGETLDFSDKELQNAWSIWTNYGDPQCGWSVITTMIEEDRFIYCAYNKVPSEQVSEDSATLNKLLKETVVKIITGAQDVESYDSFLDTWYALGGQNAMDEANADR